MDLCHLKNSELETKHQKYKGRIVLRGDIVKDDSGSYAVFTEQGSSASYMTAAKVMDIISRLPGCDGQAADAVYAQTQPNYWKFPNRNVQTFGFVHRNTNGQNHGPIWKTQSFLLSEICMVILWQDYYGNGSSRKFYLNTFWKKSQIWECLSVNRAKRTILTCVWTRSNWLGKGRTSIRLGKFWWKTSSWENQHHSLSMFLWVAPKDNVKTVRRLWIITKYVRIKDFCRTEKKPETRVSGKPDANTISSWSYDMEGHAKNCVERCCELAKKKKQRNNFSKSRHTAKMTINLKKKQSDLLENCEKFAHKLSSNVCIWLVLGDLTYYGLWTNLLVWSQNGQKLVTNVWRVWPRTVTHVSTDNIVM